MPNIEKVNLSNVFSMEIIEPTIDLSIDYSELFIDDIIDNEILKEIPIVKTVIGTIKAGISINQFWFAKKLLTFIREFNLGIIENKKTLAFQDRITNDDHFRKKAVEQIMIFIDKHIEINKTKISAKLLQAYALGNITFDDFISLNISLEMLHPNSYKFFGELESMDFEITNKYKGPRKWDIESLLATCGLGIDTPDYWHGFKLKDEGKLLYKYGILPIITQE